MVAIVAVNLGHHEQIPWILGLVVNGGILGFLSGFSR